MNGGLLSVNVASKPYHELSEHYQYIHLLLLISVSVVKLRGRLPVNLLPASEAVLLLLLFALVWTEGGTGDTVCQSTAKMSSRHNLHLVIGD